MQCPALKHPLIQPHSILAKCIAGRETYAMRLTPYDVSAVLLIAAVVSTCGCSPVSEDRPLKSRAAAEPAPSVSAVRDSRPASVTRYDVVVPFRAKYAGVIKPGIYKDYAKHTTAMTELMAEWNPVELARDQVVFVLGPPTSEDLEKNTISYSFENGFFGMGWKFHFERGVVASVTTYGIQ